ncbi:hypothetical protein, partial [Acetobacter pasteurianus]
MDNNYLSPVVLKHNDNQESLGFLSGIGNTQEIHTHFLGNLDQVRALLEIRYDRFSRGFERDSKAGCGR